MKSVLYLFITAVVFLVLSLLFLVHKGQHFTLIQSSLKEMALQLHEDQYDKPTSSYEEKTPTEKASDCRFAFGFLKSLRKNMKPVTKPVVEKPFRRPFTGAIIQDSLCLDSMDGIEGDVVQLGPCHGQGRNQEWTFTEMKQIRSEGRGTLCLTWDDVLHGKKKNLILQKCNNVNIKQKWHFDKIRKHIMPTVNPRLCVTTQETLITLKKCDSSIKRQNWMVIMTEILNIELQVGD